MKKMELPVSSILTGLLIGVSGAIYLGSGKALEQRHGLVGGAVDHLHSRGSGKLRLPPVLGICDVERSSGLCEEIGSHLAGQPDWMYGNGTGGCACKTGLSGDGVRADCG